MIVNASMGTGRGRTTSTHDEPGDELSDRRRGADVSGGGVRSEHDPQEGGNKFSGAFFGAWSDAPGRATT